MILKALANIHKMPKKRSRLNLFDSKGFEPLILFPFYVIPATQDFCKLTRLLLSTSDKR